MRSMLVWLGCALTLAAVACEDDSHTLTSSRAEFTPTVTVTTTPTAAVSPTPASAPSPAASPAPGPALPQRQRWWEPRPTPLPFEPTLLTHGEPRSLPAGLAIYYWAGPCTACSAGGCGLERVVGDGTAHAKRRDRPLEVFDGLNRENMAEMPYCRDAVRSFGVSTSGQTLAATVCHVGFCEHWSDGSPPTEHGWGRSPPTVDAELRLWVSQDNGRNWQGWGLLLPGSRIVEVTGDDVLITTQNIWGERWAGLSEAAWDEMIGRLALLGLDTTQGWERRFRWVASGEAHSQPLEPIRPAFVGGLSWRGLGERSDGTFVWAGRLYHGGLLIALADADGAVQRSYITSSRYRYSDMLLLADDLILTASLAVKFVPGTTIGLVDLATMSVHIADGLTLPPLQFIAARPAPLVSTK